ncbi:hypothetical protein H5P36_25650 [Bacillus sp. APMAM]|nr:hypothetical protein [Bacillus sp. APMAM]RTZ53054.1 hypothetical protein EKO25_25500 [Bacillus sp. SAJ1]
MRKRVTYGMGCGAKNVVKGSKKSGGNIDNKKGYIEEEKGHIWNGMWSEKGSEGIKEKRREHRQQKRVH